MEHQLRPQDVKRIVKGASVQGPSLSGICAWIIGMGITIWLMLAYVPGCIERDNERLEAEQAAMMKEKPCTPITTEGLETIKAAMGR